MQKLKGFYAGMSNKAAVAGVLLVSGMSAAHAELPAVVASTFADVKADADALFTMIVPYVVAILGTMIVIKLIKRYGNKI